MQVGEETNTEEREWMEQWIREVWERDTRDETGKCVGCEKGTEGVNFGSFHCFL